MRLWDAMAMTNYSITPPAEKNNSKMRAFSQTAKKRDAGVSSGIPYRLRNFQSRSQPGSLTVMLLKLAPQSANTPMCAPSMEWLMRELSALTLSM